ncbi:MAG: phage integrase SAM-like domain-containing protein [Saccharofermentans sp.]|nr:phage integrase SAM-like domain-containing protein [Saccharofermentans sp.]
MSFCLDYYYKNHLETLKPKTANGYRAVIESRLFPYFSNMRIKNITPLDVRGWMASLERKDGQDKVLSRNSTGSWFRTLSAILGKAYEWEIIDENPCKRVKSPANTQPDVEALQLSEVQTICDKLPEYDDIRARTCKLV